MKKTNIIIIIFCFTCFFLFISACNSKENVQTTDLSSNITELKEKPPEYCNSNSDCICKGVHPEKPTCFIGNINYYTKNVDKEKPCPIDDFCQGPYGNMKINCIANKCIQMPK